MADVHARSVPPAESDLSKPPDFDVVSLYNAVRPSTVHINSIEYDHGQAVTLDQGKGAFLDDSRINEPHTCKGVTDNHVVAHSAHPSIQLANGITLNGTIYDRNPQRDLAYFRIGGIANPAVTCPGMKVARSLSPGEAVLDILDAPKRPFAYFRLEAIEPKYLQPNMEQLEGEDVMRDLAKFPLSSTPVVSGDSGSAMVNKRGELASVEEAVGMGYSYGTMPNYVSEDLDRQAAKRQRGRKFK